MQPREVVPLIRRLREPQATSREQRALCLEAADALQTLAHDLANARMAETLIEAQDAEIEVIRAEHTALLELEKAVRAYGTSESATWTGVQRVLDELAKARDARATTERPEPLPQTDHEMSNPTNDPEEPITLAETCSCGHLAADHLGVASRGGIGCTVMPCPCPRYSAKEEGLQMAPLTDEQKALRKTGIGSSDIAAIMGEDPYRSALDVWLDKTGRATPRPDTAQSDMGHRLEDVIAQAWAERHGDAKLERCTTIRHAAHEIALATPDRRVVEVSGGDAHVGEIVECKSVGWRMIGRWRSTTDPDAFVVPPYVELQGQWQCLIADAPAFWVAAWLGGRDPIEQRFAFDAELGGAMLEVAEQFWTDHVLTDVQPSPDGSERARETIAKLYPQSTKQILRATPEIERLARAYVAARRVAKDADRAKEEAANALRAAIGEHGGFAGSWGRVT